MPCTAPARGIRQAAPHTGPPFNDTYDNNPCGRQIVTVANGINYSAHSLCLFHLMMKLGSVVVNPPYTSAARATGSGSSASRRS
jgi:hypothetical protein